MHKPNPARCVRSKNARKYCVRIIIITTTLVINIAKLAPGKGLVAAGVSAYSAARNTKMNALAVRATQDWELIMPQLTTTSGNPDIRTGTGALTALAPPAGR
jgi:hypothetical protein